MRKIQRLEGSAYEFGASEMSDEAKPTQSPLTVEVGAKAEAKFEIKTEIPSESSGRLVDTLVDIIRPFSEKRGLRADLIRLQREEVAIAIAFKATERLRITGDTPHSIPNKILVPMLEKASLEDPNSELIDRWANLLASTARCPHIKAITFADVLSQLGGDQAQLLDRIGVPRWKVVPEPLLSSTMGVVRGSNWLDRIYTRGIQRLTGFGKHVSLLLLQQEIDESDLCYTVELRVASPASHTASHTHTEVDRYYSDNKIDFDILERQSLIEKHNFEMFDLGGDISVTIYGLTELGIEFLYSIGSPHSATNTE